jgi:polysaccharide chain length determinant protein (PEP-CTERM system associated)
VVAVIAVSVVLLLPPIYRSTGTVAVESQQIPADLVRSTVLGSADERIGFIKQIVMTEARLVEIIRQFGLYPEDVAALPMSRAVEKLRKNVDVAAIRDPYASKATIAFTVAFDHTDPETARNVATEIVDLFLAENARTRNVRAMETAAFLREETESLSKQVRSLDHQVAEFKQNNSDALPEHLDLRVTMLQKVEFDLRAVQRDIAAAEQERRFLEAQLDSLSARLPVQRGVPAAEMTAEERLQALKADLARASASYTEAHPDIARFKRMIAQTEAELARQGKRARSGDEAPPRDPEQAQLQARIASADTRLDSLRDQESELSARMASLQAQILKTPEVEQGLRQISFDYQSASKEYDDVRSKLQQAEMAENLESEQMAERFVLLEPPTVPVSPNRPNRLKLLALAVFLALGAGLAVAFAAEMLDNRVQDPSMLTALLGERPLAVLPYIEGAHERRTQIVVASGKWLAFGAMLGVVVLVGHQYAEPISDLLRHLYY